MDEDGDEISTMLVQWEAVPEKKAKTHPKALTTDEKVMLQAVKYVTYHGLTQSVPWELHGSKSWQKAVTWEDVCKPCLDAGFDADGVRPDALRKKLSLARAGLMIWLLDVNGRDAP